MHFLLYVCHPLDDANTSLQARKGVKRYLEQEHFVSHGRFCGHCDYFSVGGRYSGMLNLLRLKQQKQSEFNHFLGQYQGITKPEEGVKLFKNCFPDYKEEIPVYRNGVNQLGCHDDAQIMDESLFAELRKGFSEYVSAAVAFEEPNVIFTDLCEDEWPEDADSAFGRHWVVVIDYHD